MFRFAVFSDHAADLKRPSFVPVSSVPKARFYVSPRVERRESANVAEPWETRSDRTKSPNGAALAAKSIHA